MATFLEQLGNVFHHTFVKTFQPDHFTTYDGDGFDGARLNRLTYEFEGEQAERLTSKSIAIRTFFGIPTAGEKPPSFLRTLALIVGWPAIPPQNAFLRFLRYCITPVIGIYNVFLRIPSTILHNIIKLACVFVPSAIEDVFTFLANKLWVKGDEYTSNTKLVLKGLGLVCLGFALPFKLVKMASNLVLSPFKSIKIAYRAGMEHNETKDARDQFYKMVAFVGFTMVMIIAAYTLLGIFVLPLILPKVISQLPELASKLPTWMGAAKTGVIKAASWVKTTAFPWIKHQLSWFTRGFEKGLGTVIEVGLGLGTAHIFNELNNHKSIRKLSQPPNMTREEKWNEAKKKGYELDNLYDIEIKPNHNAIWLSFFPGKKPESTTGQDITATPVSEKKQ